MISSKTGIKYPIPHDVGPYSITEGWSRLEKSDDPWDKLLMRILKIGWKQTEIVVTILYSQLPSHLQSKTHKKYEILKTFAKDALYEYCVGGLESNTHESDEEKLKRYEKAYEAAVKQNRELIEVNEMLKNLLKLSEDEAAIQKANFNQLQEKHAQDDRKRDSIEAALNEMNDRVVNFNKYLCDTMRVMLARNAEPTKTSTVKAGVDGEPILEE